MTEQLDEALVCIICGEPWMPAIKNRCECGGFCTWGPAKGAKPSSWNDDGSPKAPPIDALIARSSLGTPEAVAIRKSAPRDVVEEVLRRVDEDRDKVRS